LAAKTNKRGTKGFILIAQKDVTQRSAQKHDLSSSAGRENSNRKTNPGCWLAQQNKNQTD
jgi:hypothetical protein